MKRPGLPGIIASLTVACFALVLMPVHARDETGVPQVTASIRPLQLIVSAITDGISTPSLLIPANQSYHDFTLRPSTVRALHDADLLVWIGPELETYLAVSVKQKAATAVVTAMELPEMTLHPLEKPASPHTEAADAQEDGHEHGHGDFDGHLWLDTGNALSIASEVTQRLAELDPPRAGLYRQNLDKFRLQLESVRTRNRAAMAGLQETSYAVYHDGFQYFEKENGLQHDLVFVLTEDMQPGVRHILALREALQRRQPVCLLEDITTNPATVRTVLGDYRLRQERVDVLGGGIEPGAEAYAQLIGNMATAFERCIGGN